MAYVPASAAGNAAASAVGNVVASTAVVVVRAPILAGRVVAGLLALLGTAQVGGGE
jgi:hypothetical protein